MNNTNKISHNDLFQIIQEEIESGLAKFDLENKIRTMVKEAISSFPVNYTFEDSDENDSDKPKKKKKDSDKSKKKKKDKKDSDKDEKKKKGKSDSDKNEKKKKDSDSDSDKNVEQMKDEIRDLFDSEFAPPISTIAYSLYGVEPVPGKDTNKMKNARSLATKKIEQKTVDDYTYDLTPMEANHIYHDLSSAHLTESIKRAVLKELGKTLNNK